MQSSRTNSAPLTSGPRLVPSAEPAVTLLQQCELPASSGYPSIQAALAAVEREVQSIGTDLDRALRLIANQAQILTRASGAAIALAPAEQLAPGSANDEMPCRAVAGADAPALGARLKAASGFSGECVRSRQLLRCDDSESDPRVDRESCRMIGIRSMVAVPVKDSETVLGIIEVFSRGPEAFSEGDSAALQRLAELASSAVGRAYRAALLNDTRPEVKKGSAHVSSKMNPRVGAAPRLSLLVELEPASRIFFRNLRDMVLCRPLPATATTSRPGLFWSDVFVCSEMPWRWLLQSLLWHVLAVAAVWTLFPWQAATERLRQQKSFRSYVSYYSSSPSFPALGSSHSRLPTRTKGPTGPARQLARIRVAPERTQRITRPPDIKLAEPAQRNIESSNPALPAMPPSAIRRSQLTVPAGPTAVVAPPPGLNQATTRRPGVPQVSVLGPPTGVEIVLSQRGITAPSAAVVAPPPTVPGSLRTVGNTEIGHYDIVAPSPQLPSYQQRTFSGTAQATVGSPDTSVVPPPPSVERNGTLSGERTSSPSDAGLQVVPPPASVQAAGNSASDRRPTAADIPPRPAINNPPEPATDELPVRLIASALALPNSSFFSNYEVFIAERRLSRDDSQLIKLVYVFLPYQRRLSEYGLNSSRVYKLRVTRDATCDETLLEMTWPQTDPQHSIGPPALSPNDRNSKLPCYRTTADDYRRALSRRR